MRKKEEKFVVLETLWVPITSSPMIPKGEGRRYPKRVLKTRLLRLDGRERWDTVDKAKRCAEYVKTRVKHSAEYSYEVAKIVKFKEVAA